MHRSQRLRWHIAGTAIAFALGVLSGAASAQQPTQAQAGAIRQFCRSDFASNCAGVPTGGQAALQCLRSHIATLSPECQNAVNAVGSAPAPAPSASAPAPSSAAPSSAAIPPPEVSRFRELRLMRRSCGDDFGTYCKGVELGGGRGVQCLKENESKLSPTCKNALTEMPQGR